MPKFVKFSVLFACICFGVQAQILNPVKWKFNINDKSEIVMQASIEKGWHLYDMNLPEGGPQSTNFVFEKVEGAELVGRPSSPSNVTKKYDEMFEMDLRWYETSANFTQKIKITNKEQFKVSGYAVFMVCNDESCLPPEEVPFNFTKTDLPAGIAVAEATSKEKDTPKEENKEPDVIANKEEPTQVSESDSSVVAVSEDQTLLSSGDLWKPVIDELRAYGEKGDTNSNKWWVILLTGFVGGFIALLTPCVWPMIPMTVSFFLKRSKTNRKKAITDAVTYGVSIVVIYLILGLLITAIFGASALNDLSTSALFNLIFFALLVVFAISFFGAFEITLPSSWTNKLDSKAESTTGLLSIFFMAFTLVLVSFSCTGPIIGTLLVEAASSGSITGPAIGMFGFALALSIPFALFAIFPSWLQNLPKSGGWLNSVKVVLGFLELALALKFLSVADLAYGWRILDREVFLVLWIIIFVLLGLYLLGKIKFSHDSDLPYVSVPRLFMATISLSFALYMVPGLWGAPLKAISAFSPPLNTQDFSLYHGEVTPQFTDYESGMEYAKRVGKPVLVDFTGFGCVNCRKMEAAVWTDARVKQLIDKDYVLISLFVDDKAKLPEAIEIEEAGKKRTLKTIGDKWSYLQRSKFGANAQPFYILLDNEGMPIGPSYAYKEDIGLYIDFLKKGLEEYKK